MPYLPGNTRALRDDEKNVLCEEEGCNCTAVKAMAGEVDSFGVEWIYLCQVHLNEVKEEMSKPVSGYCEWHKGKGEDIRPYRDLEEGSNGRVYDVCYECRAKNAKYWQEY